MSNKGMNPKSLSLDGRGKVRVEGDYKLTTDS